MLPLSNGVATSQSVVNNDQVQSGDVLATDTLNVVVQTGTTSSLATATGNAMVAATVSGGLDVESTQTGNVTNPGNVNAVSHVGIATDGGTQVIVNAAATGNTVEADSLDAGPLTGNISQTTTPNVSIVSEYDFNAAAAQAGGASVSSQAIGNSIGYAVANTTSNVTSNQVNNATIDAEGGSEITGGATLQFTGGTAAFSTTAVGNNLTAIGTGTTAQTIDATQVSAGPLVQGGNFVTVGNAQTIEGDATVTANNIAITNQADALNVVTNQSNASFTFADSVATGFEFGDGQATAFGVGNSMLAGNFGPSTTVSNTQVNTGGIEANASFTGDNGFDASTSATAMGNAAIAFACSQCGGVINITNSQTTSGGGVEANATTNITTQGRSVSSVATAVGNNATFYVSKPTN